MLKEAGCWRKRIIGRPLQPWTDRSMKMKKVGDYWSIESCQERFPLEKNNTVFFQKVLNQPLQESCDQTLTFLSLSISLNISLSTSLVLPVVTVCMVAVEQTLWGWEEQQRSAAAKKTKANAETEMDVQQAKAHGQVNSPTKVKKVQWNHKPLINV